METLTAAAACAAYLMSTQPVLPDAYVEMQPLPQTCREAGDMDGDCRGVFTRQASGRTIVTAIDHFGVLVHESCHVILDALGQPQSETVCYAVQDRAGECFRGMGALEID